MKSLQTFSLVACLALTACMPVSTGGKEALITGVFVYRERIPVPPEAELRASLEDISSADTPSVRIAEIRFQSHGA